MIILILMVINGVALRSVAHRNEPVVGKSDSPGGNKLHNVMLRLVRKPEAVLTKSEDDNDKSRTALNICLRPVCKPEPVAKQSKEKESDSSRPHNVFLRPLPKPEPFVSSDNTEDSHGKFQHVHFKPIVYPMGPKSSGSKVTDTELTPIDNRTSSDVPTETEPGPLKIRTSSEVLNDFKFATCQISNAITVASWYVVTCLRKRRNVIGGRWNNKNVTQLFILLR